MDGRMLLFYKIFFIRTA